MLDCVFMNRIVLQIKMSSSVVDDTLELVYE